MSRFPLPRFLSLLVVVLVVAPLFAQEPTPTERLLLPILTPPVHGAFGSEFHTDLRIANNSAEIMFLFGLEGDRCSPICLPGLFPLTLEPGQEAGPDDIVLNGSPGRFIFAAKDQISSLSMNLRVHDVTRGGLNYGTEIPIVRESEFGTKVVFVGVPTDARFRNTLRIYSQSPIDVLVTVGQQAPVRLRLSGGFSFPNSNIIFPEFNTPSYAAFSNFPAGLGPVRVTVEVESLFLPLFPIESPLWAFITVTNNETQVISTITPQP